MNNDPTIEVFKTNVQEEQGAFLLRTVREAFPHLTVNFDAEDCDKILRIKGTDFSPENIIQLLHSNDFFCEILE